MDQNVSGGGKFDNLLIFLFIFKMFFMLMNSVLKMLYVFLMFVSKVSQILILVLKQTKALSFLEKKKTQGFCNLSGFKVRTPLHFSYRGQCTSPCVNRTQIYPVTHLCLQF